MFIGSTSNNRIKEYSKLKQKKYRDEFKLFIVEGIDLVNAALNRKVVKTIFTTNEEYRNEDVEVIYTNEQVIEKLSSTSTPQGIVAICSKFDNENVIGNRIMILDGIQDPSNAGAISRSCLAFGYDTLILSSTSVDVYNDKFLRSSKGANFELNIIQDDLEKVYRCLKKEGYLIISSALSDSVKLPIQVDKEKIALVVGNEGQGISELTKNNSDYIVRIDISDRMESLNVGVAASILMYTFSNYSK